MSQNFNLVKEFKYHDIPKNIVPKSLELWMSTVGGTKSYVVDEKRNIDLVAWLIKNGALLGERVYINDK